MRDKPIEWTAEDEGKAEEEDPQGRKEVLERQGEYAKAEGMTEIAIPNMWVGFGFGLRKPDGWRDL